MKISFSLSVCCKISGFAGCFFLCVCIMWNGRPWARRCCLTIGRPANVLDPAMRRPTHHRRRCRLDAVPRLSCTHPSNQTALPCPYFINAHRRPSFFVPDWEGQTRVRPRKGTDRRDDQTDKGCKPTLNLLFFTDKFHLPPHLRLANLFIFSQFLVSPQFFCQVLGLYINQCKLTHVKLICLDGFCIIFDFRSSFLKIFFKQRNWGYAHFSCQNLPR